jgi:hypothetical protein
MNDQPTGQWVYLVRRIMAVLVLLLLVALLIPHAYQALLGPRGETSSGVQESADSGGSDNSGSYDEGASNGVASSAADDVAKQGEDVSDSLSSSGQTDVSDGVTTAARYRETDGEDYYGGVESDEATPDAAGEDDVPDEVAVGEAEQTVPTPVVDVGSQQSIQPILSTEPVGPLELLTSAEPITSEDTITPQNLAYYDYPVYYEEPTYYDYSDYYDSAYYDYSDYYYEEQMLEGWYPSGNYNSAAVATASVQAGGGATAYAAVGGGATAYAAAGGGVGAYAAVSTG